MIWLTHARSQALALQRELTNTQNAEFAYNDSKDALRILEERLKDLLSDLDSVDHSYDDNAARNLAINTTRFIQYNLPLLGFILRSPSVASPSVMLITIGGKQFKCCESQFSTMLLAWPRA